MKYHTFMPQFHPLILAGTKTTTIRGSTRVKEGERFALRCWTGRPYGSPMGWLGTATCSHISDVRLESDTFHLSCGTFGQSTNYPHHLDHFARLDGFRDWSALVEHFGKRLPFTGVRISWTDFVPGKPEEE